MMPFIQTISNALSRSAITAIPYFPDDFPLNICSIQTEAMPEMHS